MDDTTLLVNLLRVESQSVSPIMEDKQTGVNNVLVVRRHITYIIYRLGDTCISVEVGTKLDTLRLTPSENTVAGEMLGSVEAHVLKEVSETALRLLLLNRAHLLCDVELRTVFGPCVVTDIIRQTIVQLTDFHVLIHGDRRHLLCHSDYCKQQQH